jgi:hypothetical protein
MRAAQVGQAVVQVLAGKASVHDLHISRLIGIENP